MTIVRKLTNVGVRKYPDGFVRIRWAGYLAGSAAVALGGINHRHKHVLNLREDITDRIIWAPAHASRAFVVFTEQAKVHIDLGHTDLNILFTIKVHTYKRSTWADPCTACAVFPAVVLIKSQYGSQDTGNAVLSRVSTDDIVWTRSDTVATAGTEPFEGQFIHGPRRPKGLQRFVTGKTQDAC